MLGPAATWEWRVQTAEDEAIRALCAEHAGPLLSFALRLTGGDRGRAEDIVQETLLRAWRHPQVLDPARGALRPWLFTVAHRVAIDAHRARRSRPLEVALPPEDQLPLAEEVERALDAVLVAEALASLSRDHRRVLEETYFAGRTVAEAAELLGVPAGTVKSRSYYALRAMRLALEERGVTL
jgi:RNA polymerase sigma-70 factor (ECF subfamily)